jgi:hypothetical protein
MYENAMADNIDLKELDRYLNSNLSPDDCMGLSDLDGSSPPSSLGQTLSCQANGCL